MFQKNLLKYKALPISTKVFIWLIFLGILLELFLFYRLPKQAWTEALLEAWYTSNGLIFYKDFTNQYFPFLHMLMVPYHKLFGFTQTPTIILAPINSLLVLGILSIASFKWLKGWLRCLPILFFLFWDPILSENHYSTLAFLEIVNLLVFILWKIWFKKPNKILALFIGLGLSASFLSMHIVILYVLTVFLSIFIKVILDRRNFESFIYAMFGAVLPAAFIIIWFTKNDALYEMYWWNVAYYFSSYPFSGLGRGLINTILFIAVFSPGILFLRLFYLRIRKRKTSFKEVLSNKDLLELILTISILAGFPLTIWFAIFHPIRFELALPIFALALGLGIQSLLQLEKRLKLSSLLIVCLILITNVLSFFLYMLPKYQSSFSYNQQYNILSKVYPYDPMYTAVEWIKENTPKDAKLFVLADPLFYIETNRLPANSRGTMGQPFVYEPLNDFRKQLNQKPPDYWVVDERLIHERFKQFGYPNTTKFFDKLLFCEPVATRIEYITIRKHIKNSKFCF